MKIDVRGKMLSRAMAKTIVAKSATSPATRRCRVILYSDPSDDAQSVALPTCRPWRPETGVQRDPLASSRNFPGDVTTPELRQYPHA